MKTALTVLAALSFSFLFHPSLCAQGFSAKGIFSKLRGNKPSERVLSPAELSSMESQASADFQKAQSLENSGRQSKARDLYKSIAKSYPNTKVGAEAQFRVAQIRDKEGDGRKAYDEYRTLITKYRGSAHFQTAIERQFAIAEGLRNSGRKGFMGIGAPIQPSDLKKMYEEISEAAPYTEYAPRSLMAIANLNAAEGNELDAIRNYQSVVDNYRGTSFASDAQFQIYKLRGDVASQSNSPSEDRAQVDAGLDFVAQNPNDMRAEQVRAGLEAIEERSLEKNFKTAQFYEKSGKHEAALVYYREILKKPTSKYYAEATARVNAIRRIQAGQAVEEKANRFGPLPSLPKLERPKFRFGKKDEVVPIPTPDVPPPVPPTQTSGN